MTQQQLSAYQLLATLTRDSLKAAALATGRNPEAVGKASTLRLALWVGNGASAI